MPNVIAMVSDKFSLKWEISRAFISAVNGARNRGEDFLAFIHFYREKSYYSQENNILDMSSPSCYAGTCGNRKNARNVTLKHLREFGIKNDSSHYYSRRILKLFPVSN